MQIINYYFLVIITASVCFSNMTFGMVAERKKAFEKAIPQVQSNISKTVIQKKTEPSPQSFNVSEKQFVIEMTPFLHSIDNEIASALEKININNGVSWADSLKSIKLWTRGIILVFNKDFKAHIDNLRNKAKESNFKITEQYLSQIVNLYIPKLIAILANFYSMSETNMSINEQKLETINKILQQIKNDNVWGFENLNAHLTTTYNTIRAHINTMQKLNQTKLQKISPKTTQKILEISKSREEGGTKQQPTKPSVKDLIKQYNK